MNKRRKSVARKVILVDLSDEVGGNQTATYK